MKYPKFLTSNGTIGLVSPSLGVGGVPYEERYTKVLANFQEAGFQVKEAKNIHEFIHDPKDAARELMNAYSDDTIDVLLSVAGGEYQLLTQSELDHELLSKATPKWFMGYSDNTNFTFPLTTIDDVASIYGINSGDLGVNTWDEPLQNMMDTLLGKKLSFHAYTMCQKVDLKEERPFDNYNYDTKTMWVNLLGGDDIRMKGRLIGGCFDCLKDICGTPYDHMQNFLERYREDGIIFYFEVCNLDPANVRLGLWKMEQCGWFHNVKGIIVGRPNNDLDTFGTTHTDVIKDYFKSFQIPVITEFDVGHVPPTIPMINGAIATIISNKDEHTISYELK